MVPAAPRLPLDSQHERRPTFAANFSTTSRLADTTAYRLRNLVPADDPTLLFTNAGMVQFKRTFLGQDPRPYVRATTCQKCVRAGGKHNDLEQVGQTKRHHTFFEMLGNFSFGDYFKREAIAYAWEFVTSAEGLGIEPDRLRVTVHHTDDEAQGSLAELTPLPADRIYRTRRQGQLLADGRHRTVRTVLARFSSTLTGPRNAGAVTTSQQDFEELSEAGRFVEIWNLVFMQFDRSADGTMVPLPKPSVDTGAGLDRIASVMQGYDDIFHSDAVRALIARVEEVVGQRISRRTRRRGRLVPRARRSRARSVVPAARRRVPEQRGTGFRAPSNPASRGAPRVAPRPARADAGVADRHRGRCHGRCVPATPGKAVVHRRCRVEGRIPVSRDDRGGTVTPRCDLCIRHLAHRRR